LGRPTEGRGENLVHTEDSSPHPRPGGARKPAHTHPHPPRKPARGCGWPPDGRAARSGTRLPTRGA